MQRVGFIGDEKEKDTSLQPQLMDGLEESLQVGKMFFEYYVEGIIGTGGMGKVYKGIDRRTNKSVAIKTLKRADKNSSERFRREYRFLSEVEHPNLIKAYDFKEVGEEQFMVMEYVEGESLKEILENGKEYSLLDKIAIGSQIAQGVEALNLAGIIHRDIKPGNIMVNEANGVVKILDLGLSKSITRREMRLTRDKQILGTCAYMAPEQVEGQIAETTDIFALGTVLYQWFLGEKESPFQTENPYQTFIQIATYKPTGLGKLVQGEEKTGRIWKKLNTIIRKAMEKKPEKRQENAGIIAEKLLEIYEEIKEGGYIPKTVIVERKWVVPKTTIVAKTSLIKMRREFMDKDISISSSSMIMTNSGGYKRRKKKVQKEKVLRNMVLLIAIMIFVGSMLREKILQETIGKLELLPEKMVLMEGEEQKFTWKVYNKNREIIKEQGQNLKVTWTGGTFKNGTYTAGKIAGKYEIEVVAENGVTAKAEIEIKNKTPFAQEIWETCWKGEYFDFTEKVWEKLSVEKQIEYTTKYQEWYAQQKNTTVRKSISKNGATFAVRLIPPGKYWMGSETSEEGRDSDEKRHMVLVSKAFWLGETEVTQKQWEQVVGKNPSYFKGDDKPVEKVSWNDSVALCEKIGARLPTEAEWEYACRGGTTTKYYWGEKWDKEKANSLSYWGDGEMENFSWNGYIRYMEAIAKKKSIPIPELEAKKTEREKGLYLGNILAEKNVIKTTSVKSFSPNSFGVYDMLGNVWEWCSDWYGDYDNLVSEKGGVITDPKGLITGSFRVARGGSWNDSPAWLRAAVRIRFAPEFAFSDLGFRCVFEAF